MRPGETVAPDFSWLLARPPAKGRRIARDFARGRAVEILTVALTPGKSPAGPADNSDPRQNLFLQEVDEALREDQFFTFLSRYGRYILLLVVAGLLGFAGWLYYQHLQNEEAGKRSEQLIVALDAARSGNLTGALGALKPLEDADQPGYRSAVALMKAAIALEQRDTKAAVAEYEQIIADDGLPQPLRDLALVRQTAAQYDDLAPAEVIRRLKPLAIPGNPWFGSAGEMTAVAHMRMNKPDLAGALFLQLAEDEQVPQTIRSRARQLAGVMGVDAVDDPNAAQGVASSPVAGSPPLPGAAE